MAIKKGPPLAAAAPATTEQPSHDTHPMRPHEQEETTEDTSTTEHPQSATPSEPTLAMVPQPEPQSSHTVPATLEERKILIPKASVGLPAAIPSYAVMNQDPEYVRQVIKDNLGTQMLRVFDLQFITVPTGGNIMWQIDTAEGVESTPTVEGVIVAWIQPRSYWKVSFDESGGGSPPDCQSQDGFRGIGTPGGDCLRCPLSQFGSAPKGEGQACRQSRLLFLMRPDSFIPCVIKAPATSIRPMQEYFVGGKGKQGLAPRGIAYHHVVTSFALEPDKNSMGIKYAKIKPTMKARLSAEETQKIQLLMQTLQPLVQQVARDRDAFNDD